MCDPYYGECDDLCDPYYDDCTDLGGDQMEGPPMMGGKGGDAMMMDGDDEDISHMPFLALWGASTIMVFGSFYGYTEEVLGRTDGGNYKGMFYATQIAWIPVFIAGVQEMLVGNETSWGFMHEAMWEMTYGPMYYNWIGLGWAQYQRSIQNTTDFTSSNNLTALGINVAWNIVNMFMGWYLVGGVSQMEAAYGRKM